MRDARGGVLAVAVWAAALCAVMLPGTAQPMAVVAPAGAAVWMLGPGRRRRASGLVVLVLLCCGAVAASVVAVQPTRAAAAELDGRIVEVVAEVTSSASVGRDGKLWVDARTITVGAPGVGGALRIPVRVGIEQQPGVDLGAVITVTGQAEATAAGERAALVVFSTRGEVSRTASGIFAVAAQTREQFVARATRLPDPGSGLLPGLAVGDTRAVGTALYDAMLASGLSHLTAVSGANCAIVVAAVFWFVALCGGGRRLRVFAALTALAAFVVLVTPEPSVIRAAVMAAFAMLTLLLGRPSAGVAMLAVAVVGILMLDPWLAATPGFALSAAATAALLLLARPLARGLRRWMPPGLALIVAVPLSAQLVCGPIVALFSEQQSLISVAANLLAGPAAPIATVIGLLACLAAPVPPLADLLAATAWLPSSWIAATAMVSAELPGATIAVAAGPVAALVVAVLSVALSFVIVPGGVRGARTVAAFVLVAGLAIAGGRMLLTGPIAALTAPDDWAIAQCDVGQGDAALVRSEGKIALIDTGPDPGALSECLSSLGVSRIDLLVLTHFDLDHAGGARAVRGRVGTVLHSPPGRPGDIRILDELGGAGARLIETAAGRHGTLGGAAWQVHWPAPASAAFPTGNDASVVMEFSGGGVPRSVFLGDLSAVPQRMLARGVSRDYAVVKVAHHGSRDQDPALYAQLDPDVALISVGEGNDYGHPRKETLGLLKASGAQTFRTDQHGRILLALRDGGVAVWTDGGVAGRR